MANTFITLTDTPSSYAGKALNFLRVNASANAVVFSEATSNDLADINTSGAYTPAIGEILSYTASGEFRPVSNDPYSAGNGLSKTGSTLDVVASGGLEANANSIYISDIANVAGTYGNNTVIPVITVNSKGQITDIEGVNANLDIASNYVGSITGTAGQIVVTGGSGQNASAVVNLVATGVTAATYGNSTHLPQITVDTYGRIQNVDMVAVQAGNIIGGNGNINLSNITTQAFRDIVVPGSTTVSASGPQDVLTFNAGPGMIITTNAGTDTITFTANSDTLLANASVTEFGDVDITGIVDNDVLVWDSANSTFVAGQAATAIADLTDVSNATPNNGDLLIFNTTTGLWEPNQANIVGGGGNVVLTDFSVVTTAPNGNGALSYNNAGVYTFTPADVQSALSNTGVTAGTYGTANTIPQFTVDAAGRITAASNQGITLDDTGVAAGTYGDSGNVAQVTVDSDGRVSSVTQVPITGISGAIARIERFKLNYDSSGSLQSVANVSAGIDNIIIQNSSGGEVLVNFNSSFYNFPPTSVMFYGYDYANNKYTATPFESTVSFREVPGGGSIGDPTLFDGNDAVQFRVRLRESETGASRGGFGTTTHAWIQFLMYD